MNRFAGTHVVLRTDASLQIGTGHVMRCLTLASALREQGAICRFVTRGHTGHLAERVRANGFDVALLARAVPTEARSATTAHDAWLAAAWAQDAEQTIAALGAESVDWLVVDHYGLERRWETALQRHTRRLLVIDDLADRAHTCDLLLDHNLGRSASDYTSHARAACGVLAGPRFALLRPQFGRARERGLRRRQQPALRRLLVALGGVDAGDATGAVLDALQRCELPPDLTICVVMGAHAPALAGVREHAARMRCPTEVRVDVDDMAGLMADADLAIGAAGGSAWERCCVGLPTLLVVLAANQEAGARALQAEGAAILLGASSALAEVLPGAMRQCVSADRLAALSAAASQVADGAGAARVLDQMARCDG
jgi:UDP-2,4-diacetamido-2,4,6-trideoxy-beta-L-altropyranose hydrolase